MSKVKHTSQKKRRQTRVRNKIKGKEFRPRLTVFRSNKYVWAQIIDDQKNLTLVASNSKTLKPQKKNPTKTEMAALVGEDIAKKALKKKLKKVRFDRGSYQYHGRVKALAEAARKAGLEF